MINHKIFWSVEEIQTDDDIDKVDQSIHDYLVTVKINEWEFTRQMDDEEYEHFKKECL